MVSSRVLRAFLILFCALCALPAEAQQTGALSGRVTDTGGGVLPGVTVEARSALLPTPRVTVTEGTGDFRLPALVPGTYTVTFTLSGMQTATREAEVQLGQDTVVNVTLGVQGLTETVTVTAVTSLVERDSATIASGVSNQQIMAMPVGQEYRDLVKLIPAVQVTQDQTRGPSAGGSGQDNIYQFDGVNVTLPLFGTLSAEPASHDIAQVTTIKGGARAIDFDRSGGFTIDSVSKSGGSRFAGELSFQLQDTSMVAEQTAGALSRFEQDRTWLTGNFGGPIVPNKLHFYGSYYRPENRRENASNLYGALPQFERTRNEGFGKLTFTPTSSTLFNVSYRDSKREDIADTFLQNAAATSGTGSEARLRIGIAEGSWILGPRSHLTFKYTHFANETLGRPDNVANVSPTDAIGTRLDIANLDQQGRVSVPLPIAGQTAFNSFIQPIVDRYGYDSNGVRTGGGIVGYGLEFNDQDFFRDSGQVGYNVVFGSTVAHDVHVGYQHYLDSERLLRSSNGWGSISVPGGRTNVGGTPIFYTARYQRQTGGRASPIESEYRSQSFEINDTIRWQNWTFNAGIVVSNDRLYGQGLREDESTLSGFVASSGTKYQMYEIPFSKMIQPRLGATWAYNGTDTVYASYARYNPAASSLPRAASWDRNLIGTFIDAHFDAGGVLFAALPVGSSSGKLFVDDLTPRTIDEFLVGTARQITPQWSARLYGRYRDGSHFWEDTNNNARIAFRSANTPAGVPAELYIPDLTAKLAQIGSGSSYVIAELDGAYTKYYEATLESEWRGPRAFVRGSYTWSHYYGNFDQDNTTSVNDANSFIGSSFIA
ncbi:MAG: carboxypeptidase regulatory-like domain-containing protein, partial [Vicinamibacterales bacterium]